MGLDHDLMLWLAKSFGLFYLMALALAVLVYAFWPANKARFERAARTILIDEEGPWG